MIPILFFVTLCVLFPQAAQRLLLVLLWTVRCLVLEAWRACERHIAKYEGRDPREFPPEP
jgi:hypothetical protein